MLRSDSCENLNHMKNNPRRQFIHYAVATGILLAGASKASKAAGSSSGDQQERPPALPGDLVREFVIAGHSDLVKVKEMLATEPTLLNATWDWGKGDFETAMGGAGHMGNREIAEYLLTQGARLDIFGAAMLGKLDIVQSFLTSWPNLKMSRGPHGFTLVQHATKGGELAAPVLKYLKEIGSI